MNVSTISSSPGKLDTRSDLGYGTTVAKFHNPRSADDTFPYVKQSEPTEPFEQEDEFIDAINKKSLAFHQTDPYARMKITPFYFVAGNTKLSDCFWRTEHVLNEIAQFSNSLSPIGHMYKKPKTSMTGYGAAFPVQGSAGGTYRRTGEYQGWSKAPRDHMDNEEDEIEFYSIRDLSKMLPNDE